MQISRGEIEPGLSVKVKIAELSVACIVSKLWIRRSGGQRVFPLSSDRPFQCDRKSRQLEEGAPGI